MLINLYRSWRLFHPIYLGENDANTKHLRDISELAAHFKLELKEFFESYKKLENKVVTVPDFQGKETALEIITKAVSYYKSEFKK